MNDTPESNADHKISIEVAYALPDQQKIIQLDVPPGTTAREAVRLSRIVDSFPDIDIDNATMGVFSQVLGSKGLPGPDEYRLLARDRVEIYRPLLVDPKEVRKQRAAKARQARAEKKQGGTT
ncbi:MAG: RnfH family protein [Gammaproteobacteria bacterium]|nr:MAG: RnfH family protein [Gammaproteobacteria bacterium]RLA52437.1 MAG: RnfH family protein [Gammaproteobacteria bacterium]